MPLIVAFKILRRIVKRKEVLLRAFLKNSLQCLRAGSIDSVLRWMPVKLSGKLITTCLALGASLAVFQFLRDAFSVQVKKSHWLIIRQGSRRTVSEMKPSIVTLEHLFSLFTDSVLFWRLSIKRLYLSGGIGYEAKSLNVFSATHGRLASDPHELCTVKYVWQSMWLSWSLVPAIASSPCV